MHLFCGEEQVGGVGFVPGGGCGEGHKLQQIAGSSGFIVKVLHSLKREPILGWVDV